MAEKKKVIKIDPQLDRAGAHKLENNVKQTFSNGTKTFESGLGAAVKRLGGIFAASFAFDKIISGIQDITDSATKTTKSVTKWSDDLATNAQLFDTTPTKLGRLLTTGGGAGLSDDQVYNAINRINDYLQTQREQGNAAAKTYSQNPVDAAIELINAIKKETDVTRRNAVINEVFGKRQALTYADWLLSDWKDLSNIKFTSNFDAEVERVAKLNDLSDKLYSDSVFADIWRNMGVTDETRIRNMQKQNQQELDQGFEKNQSATSGMYDVSNLWSEIKHATNPAVMVSRFKKNMSDTRTLNEMIRDGQRERGVIKPTASHNNPVPVEVVKTRNQSYTDNKNNRQNAKGINE